VKTRQAGGGDHDPTTEAAIARMKQNKAGNIKHAAGTLESYKPPPQDALELAVLMASASTEHV